MDDSLRRRSTSEVVADHLDRRRDADLEGDLARNYHPEVVVLSTGEGVSRGHDGIRFLASVLGQYVSDGKYRYHQVLTEGELAMLDWTGGPPKDPLVHNGVDTFVVREGLIVAQTIHYSSRHPHDSAARH